MANNRMILLCNVCVSEDSHWKYGDIGVMALAKWYPGGDGAYYRNNTDSMGKDFEIFMQQHAHIDIASEHYSEGAGQENPVRLEYESIGLPLQTKSNGG